MCLSPRISRNFEVDINLMSEVVQNDVILCRPTRIVSRYVTVSPSLDRGLLTDMIVSRLFIWRCEDLPEICAICIGRVVAA
jgi:hypothetical protein